MHGACTCFNHAFTSHTHMHAFTSCMYRYIVLAIPLIWIFIQSVGKVAVIVHLKNISLVVVVNERYDIYGWADIHVRYGVWFFLK